MSNLLRLHEAIAVVLLSRDNRTASIEEIAAEINKRGLYMQKNGMPTNAGQIRLRTPNFGARL